MPPEIVVHEGDEACPYLDGRIARRPLRMPTRRLTRPEFDARLERGDRRTGYFLYTQECPACSACEPLRVDVDAFVPSRTHERTIARCARTLTVERGPFDVDAERVALYRAHQEGRGLARGNGPTIDEQSYEAFLVDTCTDGFELRYRLNEPRLKDRRLKDPDGQGRLVGVAITDRAASSLSAVYTYFDPTLAALSIGTFSILTQISLARELGLRWVYLGLAIEESPHMRYKLRFLPHERRIAGVWQRFERGPGGEPVRVAPDGELR